MNKIIPLLIPVYISFLCIWTVLVGRGKSIFYSFFKTFLNFVAIAFFCSLILLKPGQVWGFLLYVIEQARIIVKNIYQ